MRQILSPEGLARLEWGDVGRPTDLIFVHANGFNARTYRNLLAPLGDAWRVLAPDLRGHGLTDLPTLPANRASWNDMRGDLIDLVASLSGPPVVLAGHSMGGTLALLTAAQMPERVRAVVMLDPVILARSAATAMRLPGGWRLAKRHPWAVAALKRRSHFENLDAAFAAYRGRGSFKGWPDATLRDYVDGGFRSISDGAVELACAPAWESSNYSAQANDAWGALRRLDRPVYILKAEIGSTCAVTQGDAVRVPQLNVAALEGGTHFFPMLMPEQARAALETAITS